MLGDRTALVFVALMAGLGAEPRPVTVGMAVSAPRVTRLELTGSVTASHRSHLSPRIPGLILKMHVDAGVMVKQGDVLMELDPELAGLELERMESELAQARIELADAGRLLAEGRALASRGAFPKSEAESRQTSYDVKTASVGQLEARTKLQRSIIERHRLVAPYDGVISRRLADAGEWVQTGIPVVELVSLENPRLDVQVPQEYVAAISDDTKVTVRLDAYPGREYPGRVVATVPVKDAVARTFLTRVEWQEGGEKAGPGMSGNAVFEIRSGERVVQVPRDAVVRFPDGGSKVWVVRDDGGRTLVQGRDVVAGDSLAETVHVIRGLEDGLRVVVRGNESLRDDQEVTVLPTIPESGKQ
jgi:RND family efflux transporter MFP subunit